MLFCEAMKKIVTIHQPSFCPYHGFFQKMEQADTIVILTECQFEKNGYQNRFNHENKWYTMRINQSLRPIKDKLYLEPIEDWRKITTAFPKLDRLNVSIQPRLDAMNSSIIRSAAQILGIRTEIQYDFPTKLTSTARLVEICKHHNATHYLSGISGRNYMDLKLFEDAQIDVVFQDENTLSKKSLIQIL